MKNKQYFYLIQVMLVYRYVEKHFTVACGFQKLAEISHLCNTLPMIIDCHYYFDDY